ncbi:hypothetical protein HPB47_001340 [Ixodes persulcatus]|uniref:Uncharacterized protein n=1 Tax=Ixodes persulcatus TaxID=34615 RepID=A0AC60PPD2_IXOPE|nr:hypothetical protein HPB47_001340 [Ixodes persulcatus]
MESKEWETFFAKNQPPVDFEKKRQRIEEFCAQHLGSTEKIVLVTSGGTSVPLEHNMVRFIDNFSAGTRGSSSAEYFLAAGYAVIFLYRTNSLKPFVRHFKDGGLLDQLELTEGESPGIRVRSEAVSQVLPVLRAFRAAREGGRLLAVPFTTLVDYLFLLRSASASLAAFGRRALLYLAAAVSDFYIPGEEMPEHKIHSETGPLQLHLQLVPKMLRPLVWLWVPEAFVVSFKLETDSDILLEKSRKALTNYKHKLVIANELHSRKHHVLFVTQESHEAVDLSPAQLAAGIEIEELIVEKLSRQHALHMA